MYVGYSSFVLFGLLLKVRPFVWEGTSRVDLLQAFAPWALERCQGRCAVDAVACCLVPRESGGADMAEVSEAHPLSECKHWMSCASVGAAMEAGGTSMESFYYRIGQVYWEVSQMAIVDRTSCAI